MKRRSLLNAVGALTLIGGTWFGGTVHAAPAPAQADVDAVAQELAERYAPVIMVKTQDAPCDVDGEPYLPMPVDIVLDNPQVALRQLSPENPTVMRAPGASDLYGLGEGFFLDFPGTSLAPGCIYERDFDEFTRAYEPTVYAHVVQQPDEPDLVFVQYWFWWYFNDWNNKHESDWEGITLKFEASTLEQALADGPVAVGFSQHEGGERADWDDDKLSKEGDRPVVYSSAGSHASYYGSALYLGRSASEGFGCDDTGDPSTRVAPDVILLPDAVDDPSDPLAWLGYEGRWGERQSGAFNGPTGPAAKDRWLEPAPWFEELRASSVVIPAGDSAAAEVVDVFCSTVEWGSGLLITWTESPLQVLLVAAVLAFLVRVLVRRTDWTRAPTEPVVRPRRAGQIIRAALETYRRAPGVYITFGLVYIPAAILTGVLAAIVKLVPFVDALTSLAGSASGTSIVMAALVGSIANIAAFVVVTAVVAEYLDGDERGMSAAIAAVRDTWERRRPLAGAFLRSFATVFVLLVSIVGVPWGIRQLVRYQFLPHAVMYEERDGRDALRRSSELVRGRWWHTGLVVAVFNTAVALTALVVALLLLLIATNVPLWLFSGLTALVYALTVPLAAIGMTLLYGDAVAEEQSPDEEVGDDSAALASAP